MPLVNLLLIAAGIFAAIIVAGALIGALINLIQCLFFAAIAAVGGTLAIRFLSARSIPPAARQTVDQPPASSDHAGDPGQVAKQIEERRKRLERGE